MALLHDGKLIAIYNDSGNAYSIGVGKFLDGDLLAKSFSLLDSSRLMWRCADSMGDSRNETQVCINDVPRYMYGIFLCFFE